MDTIPKLIASDNGGACPNHYQRSLKNLKQHIHASCIDDYLAFLLDFSFFSFFSIIFNLQEITAPYMLHLLMIILPKRQCATLPSVELIILYCVDIILPIIDN